MNSGSDESVSYFFNQLCVGDPASADQLWRRYSPRLLGLARKTLGSRGHVGFEPDDVAQSAFISFWKRAADGQFARVMDRDVLWNLLGVIPCGRRARRSAMLGLKNVVVEMWYPTALGDGEAAQFDLGGQFGQTHTDDMDQTCEDLLSGLEDESRSIVLLKLMGYTNREISQELVVPNAKSNANWA